MARRVFGQPQSLCHLSGRICRGLDWLWRGHQPADADRLSSHAGDDARAHGRAVCGAVGASLSAPSTGIGSGVAGHGLILGPCGLIYLGRLFSRTSLVAFNFLSRRAHRDCGSDSRSAYPATEAGIPRYPHRLHRPTVPGRLSRTAVVGHQLWPRWRNDHLHLGLADACRCSRWYLVRIMGAFCRISGRKLAPVPHPRLWLGVQHGFSQ